MTEFSKSPVFNINLSERNTFSVGIQSFAEIILIDKQLHQVHPILYQLRKEAIPKIIHRPLQSLSDLPKDAFILAGDVSALDKHNRIVFLTNRNSVNYKHLVIINETNTKNKNNSHIHQEALQTLIEALAIHTTFSDALTSSGRSTQEQSELCLLNLYPSELKNWNLGSAKASGFDLSKPAQYINNEDILLFKQLEAIMKRRLNENETPAHFTVSQSANHLFEFII